MQPNMYPSRPPVLTSATHLPACYYSRSPLPPAHGPRLPVPPPPPPWCQDMPSKYIYEPWTAPLSVQQAANCIIGKDYPK